MEGREADIYGAMSSELFLNRDTISKWVFTDIVPNFKSVQEFQSSRWTKINYNTVPTNMLHCDNINASFTLYRAHYVTVIVRVHIEF